MVSNQCIIGWGEEEIDPFDPFPDDWNKEDLD